MTPKVNSQNTNVLVSCYTCYASGLTNMHSWDVLKPDEARELISWLVKHNGHAILTKYERKRKGTKQ